MLTSVYLPPPMGARTHPNNKTTGAKMGRFDGCPLWLVLGLVCHGLTAGFGGRASGGIANRPQDQVGLAVGLPLQHTQSH